jgi:Family of unknown function (DUF5681)
VEKKNSNAEYAIGYGKPPAHSRFRKGQSGNPRGRVKGTKNLKTDLTEELRERIQVREGHRTLKISKQRGIVKTLVAMTLKGDARAANLLMNTMARVLGLDSSVEHADVRLTAEDWKILQDFERRAFGDNTSSPTEVPESKEADHEQSR